MITLNQLHSVAKHMVIHVDVALCSSNVAMPTQFGQHARTHTLGGKLVSLQTLVNAGEPPPLNWSALIVRKAEDPRWL